MQLAAWHLATVVAVAVALGAMAGGRLARARPRGGNGASLDPVTLRAVHWQREHAEAPPSVSVNVEAAFGFPASHYRVAAGLTRIAHPDDLDALTQRGERLGRGGVDDSFHRIVDARGRVRWVFERVVVESRPGGGGRASGIMLDLGPGIDGTARHRELREVAAASEVPMIACRLADDDEQRLVVAAVNEAASPWLAVDPGEVIDRPVDAVVPAIDARGRSVLAGVAADGRARALPGLLSVDGEGERFARAFPLPGVVVLTLHRVGDPDPLPAEPVGPDRWTLPAVTASTAPVTPVRRDAFELPSLIDLGGDSLVPRPRSAEVPAEASAAATRAEAFEEPSINGLWGFESFAAPDAVEVRPAATPTVATTTVAMTTVTTTTVTGASDAPDTPGRPTLLDRASLNDAVHRLLSTPEADGTALAIVLLDLPGLGDAYERLGSSAASLDVVLAERLAAVAGADALLGRMEHDAATVVLRGVGGANDALAIAGRLVEVFDQPLGQLASLPMVTAGVALCPDHGDALEELFQRADTAVQTARHTGIAAALAVVEQERSSIQRFALMGELHRAVEEDQFVVHHQPIVACDDGRLLSFEALIRWDHPIEGLLAPGDFLPLARIARLMPSLTRLAVRQVAATTAGWALGGRRVSASVNIDLASLRDDDLLGWLASTAQRMATSGLRLTLELAEADLLEDGIDAVELLTDARRRGMEISVEHVGTTAEGRSLLAELPVDEVKLHRCFGRELADGPSATVEAVVNLARNLGARVIAEGIETPDALARARAAGCHGTQGFLVARPMPASHLEALLQLGAIGGGAVPAAV